MERLSRATLSLPRLPRRLRPHSEDTGDTGEPEAPALEARLAPYAVTETTIRVPYQRSPGD